MTKAQEYIRRIQIAQRQVDAAMRKEALCRSLAEKVTASMDSEMVSKTRNVTAHEDRMIRLMEAAEETESQMRNLEALVSELREKLVHIETPDGGIILDLRFIERKSVREIARMLYCSDRNVYRKMETALVELDALLCA